MNSSIFTKTTAYLLVISILGGFLGGIVGNRIFSLNPVLSNGDNPIIQPVEMKLVDEKSTVIDSIERVSPSVVSIVISQELQTIRSQGANPLNLFFPNDPFFNQFFGTPDLNQPSPKATPEIDPKDKKPVFQKVGGGSGFILDDTGLILTNRHVVSKDDASYTVILSDGTEYPAEVVSKDFFNDIAVIKLVPADGAKLPKLTPVTLGDSTSLKIGQSVIAIGNALAEFENSATKGIISAKGRQIVASDGMGRGENLSGLIQTDAAINPGNSGGPLVNLAGEVIGVNTAIAAGANGIGFAIPINEVKPIITSIQKNGRIVRPILGVMFTMLTPEMSKKLDLDITEGALLKGDGKNFAVLPGKPGEKAGLQEKDIIISVNDEKLTSENPLQKVIMKYAPGDTLKVTYVRKGKEHTVDITLDEAKFDKKGE